MTWCLFARTLDGLRNPDIIPWHGTGNAYVRLDLHTDQTEQCIERSTNPNRIELNKAAATPDQIERMIGMSFETFRNTIILGQGRDLFLDLEPSRKMALFSEMLNLDKWEYRSELASQSTQKFEGALSAAHAREEAIRAAGTEVAAQIKINSRENDLWEVERAKTLLAAKGDLEKMEKQHEAECRRQIKYNLAYDGAMTELKACEREITELEELRNHAKADCDKYELGIKVASAESKHLETELAKHAKGKGNCPTCGQPLTTGRNNVRNHKATIEASLAACRKTVLAGIPSAAKSAFSDLEGQVKKAQEAAQSFVAKADKARDAMDTFNVPISQLAARIEQVKKARSSKEDEVNPFTRSLSELRKRARTLSDDLKNNKAEITKHEELIECTSFWIKGFKEVRLQIIEEVLQELEICTDAMLDEVGLTGWGLLFDVERETAAGGIQRVLHVSVQSKRMPKAVKFQCFSGGEKQRLRLVGSLALADVLLNRAGVMSEFEVLDEPSRGLSVEGLYDLIDALADRARERGKAVWLCDHRIAQSNRFASVLKVEKSARGTRVSSQ